MKFVRVSMAVRCCEIVRLRWYLRWARVGFEHMLWRWNAVPSGKS